MKLMFLHDCQICESSEERIFTDSYTGLEACLECLLAIGPETALSPASEGDNLRKLAKKRKAEFFDDEDEDD